jgi:hypothetical protein
MMCMVGSPSIDHTHGGKRGKKDDIRAKGHDETKETHQLIVCIF